MTLLGFRLFLVVSLTLLFACDDGSSRGAPERSKVPIEIKGLSPTQPITEVLDILGIEESGLQDYWVMDAYGGYPNCRVNLKSYRFPIEKSSEFTVLTREIGATNVTILPQTGRVAEITFSLEICSEDAVNESEISSDRPKLSPSCRSEDAIIEAALVQKFGPYNEISDFPHEKFAWRDETSLLTATMPRHSGGRTVRIRMVSYEAIATTGLDEGEIFLPDSAVAILTERPSCEALLNSTDEAADL